MGLYQKYRPKTLNEFIGNTSTVDALQNVLNKPVADIPHAFLFSGNSGCGKTTLARIVANHLGCSDFDFKEMNSADFRGIDTVRDVIRSMHLKPLNGKVRVFLLDEVHSLSKDAMNAILKALEDTPSHVYFILATTDPQKLLKTILNRCMIFNVQPLADNSMIRLLKGVCRKEGKSISDKIIQSISQNSLGSPRSALVMLDKVIDLPEADVEKVLDEVARQESETIELCRALFTKKWKTIAPILQGLREQEPESVRRAVLGYYVSVLLKADNPQAYIVIDCFSQHFYDTGFAGLVKACYETCQ